MDETELREVLVARAERGTTRGADEMVRAVATTLRPPRPPRRRQRFVFALAMAIAVAASLLVLTARGTDRIAPAGDRGVPTTPTTAAPATTQPGPRTAEG